MYYLKLNADPTQDTWTQVIPAPLPALFFRIFRLRVLFQFRLLF